MKAFRGPEGFLLFTRHVYRAMGVHRTLPPNQREGNHKARASSVTVSLEEAEGVDWNITQVNQIRPAMWVTLQKMGKPEGWIT